MDEPRRALPVDFMQRVVAWPGPEGPGFVNLHWKSGNPNYRGLPGKPYKTLDAFMDFAQFAAAPSKKEFYGEIYFCLSTQARTGTSKSGKARAHRHMDQAIALKSIWMDVDVKDNGYASLAEAEEAFAVFRQRALLPSPSAIVHSGGGMHIYWISDRALTPAEWRPFAEGLKAEAIHLGFKNDTSLIADAARVLRVPGTYNNKTDTPRPVTLVHLGDDYDFAAALGHIAAKAPVRASSPIVVTATVIPAAFDISSWPPSVVAGLPDPMEDNLADGVRNPDLPLDAEEVEKHCLHFKDAKATHGKDHSQGLWALTLLSAAFMADGTDKAHEWSDGYKNYTHGETQAKFEEKQALSKRVGWPGCSAFEAEGVNCQTCPFYQKIKSPLNLAKQETPETSEGVPVRAAPPPPAWLELPAGYTVNTDGQICVITTRKTKTETYETEEPLFLCKLRNFMPQSGVRRLNFETSLDGNHWTVASFPEEFIGSEAKLIEALWKGGVKVNPKNRKEVPQFMASFLAKLDAARVRPNSISYGWLEGPEGGLPIGFAYNGKVYLRDETEQTAGASDESLDPFYMPKGSPAPWHEALTLITSQHHPALECIVALSFGAPLMRYTGQYNAVTCSHSYDSAAHKSTSVHVGAAVWGSPQSTLENIGASEKSVFLKLGTLRNLPIFYDEINKQVKIDKMVEILGHLTEGSEGSKLHSDRTLYKRGTWQTLMLVASNKSLVNAIMKTDPETDAQLERVFEFVVEKRGDTRSFHEVSNLVGKLDTNYGHMGIKYAKYLATHVEEIERMMNVTMKRLEDLTVPNSKERFRAFIVGAVYVGAVLANRIGATFNLSELWEYLVTEFIRQRHMITSSAVIAGSQANAVITLSAFIKASTRGVLWIRNLPVKRAGQPEAIVHVAGPSALRPDPVHIRYSKTDRLMQFSKAKFMDWMKAKDQTAKPVLDALAKHYGTFEERVTLSAGSGVAGGPKETVVTLPIPVGSPFESDLLEHDVLGPMPDTSGIVTAAVTPNLKVATS